MFVFASFLPIGMATTAAFGASSMAYATLALLAVGVPLLDTVLPRRKPEPLSGSGHGLSKTLGVAHLLLLPLGIYALGGNTGLTQGAQVALFVSLLMIFGQISNSNAHELIHLGGGAGRFLGRLVYASLLFGHHATAHPAVHHRYVATPRDPNSARRGEGLYRFLLRAWTGSFREGLRVENHRLKLIGRPAWHWSHPYWGYGLMSLVTLCVSGIIGGWTGVFTHAALALGATMQLLTSDYVQHYGLARQKDASGRYEPVAPDHSWNAPDGFSRRMMLNAPLHSEHHLRPTIPYHALSAPIGPVLPYSLPIMAGIAMIPPVWHTVMKRELATLASSRPLKPMPRSKSRRSNLDNVA